MLRFKLKEKLRYFKEVKKQNEKKKNLTPKTIEHSLKRHDFQTKNKDEGTTEKRKKMKTQQTINVERKIKHKHF